MSEVTKTLELWLLDPTANKEGTLRETQAVYQRVLRATFHVDCTTQLSANDVVVEYDLSGCAKNVLKRRVHNSVATANTPTIFTTTIR